MPINLKNTIFERFFSIFDKLKDANKDTDGKGTLERYNEVIGQDIDDSIYPFVENAHDNLIVPLTMLEKYIPYKEEDLGNNNLFLSLSPDMRRRIIQKWHRFVSIKGTLRAYEIMFGMLGITPVINELFDTGGFDSATTWDSDIRPTLDSGKCKSCSYYSLFLTGPALTTEIYNAIFSIILFNEPIDADLLELEYNGINILNIITNWEFQTTMLGSFQALFVNSGDTLFFDFNGDGTYLVTNAPAYNFLTAGVKTVPVLVPDFTTITEIVMGSQNIYDTIDLSDFTELIRYGFQFNPGLTDVILPVSSAIITEFNFNGTSVTALDASTLSEIGGIINVGNNPALATFLIPGAQSSNPTTLLNVNNTDLSGAFDMSNLLFGQNSVILIQEVVNITSVVLASVTNTNDIDEINVGKCSMITAFDFSELRGRIGVINFQDCTDLSSISAGAAYIRVSPVVELRGQNTPALLGTIDFQALPIAGIFSVFNSGFTDIIHAINFDAVDLYDVNNCTNLNYYDIKPVGGLLGADNSVVNFSDCGLIAGDVDSFLGDLVFICVTTRGETNPGAFTGRVVEIGGTNAAPTGVGLAHITTLNNLSITVNHS